MEIDISRVALLWISSEESVGSTMAISLLRQESFISDKNFLKVIPLAVIQKLACHHPNTPPPPQNTPM
jgi:hypothetical protein